MGGCKYKLKFFYKDMCVCVFVVSYRVSPSQQDVSAVEELQRQSQHVAGNLQRHTTRRVWFCYILFRIWVMLLFLGQIFAKCRTNWQILLSVNTRVFSLSCVCNVVCVRLLCPCHVLSSQENHFPASAFTGRLTIWHFCLEFSWKFWW